MIHAEEALCLQQGLRCGGTCSTEEALREEKIWPLCVGGQYARLTEVLSALVSLSQLQDVPSSHGCGWTLRQQGALWDCP